MRWNCPHCGTNLALADEKLSPNWSFSKCYQCGGFAMVRKPEINLVKVDRAPDGERVLLPEASESPILPKEAQNRLNSPMKAPVTKTIVPAANAAPSTSAVNPNRRRAATIPQRPSEWASAGLSALRETIKRENSISAPAAAANAAETPAQSAAPAPIEAPTPAAAVLEEAKMESAPPLVRPANQNSFFPNPLPELNHVMPPKPRYLPVAIGLAAALAVISGVYLYIQAQTLIERAQPKVATIDRRPAELVSEPSTASVAQAQRPNPAVQMPIEATQPARIPTTDQISASAAAAQRTAPIAAPAAAPSAPEARNPSLLVRPKMRSVNYHAGPGIGYPVIGTVSGAETYSVTDWSDRWLKVKIGNSSGWVRNDAVLVLINPQNGNR